MTASRSEIQNGPYLEEDDIVRLQDDHGRVTEAQGAAGESHGGNVE